MTRKRLATFGPRGNMIRLIELRTGTEKRLVVQWGPKGARQQQSYPATKEGRLEAEAFIQSFLVAAKAPEAAPAQLTMRGLWEAYWTAEAPHLRANTQRLYRDAWRTWEQFIGASTIAEDVGIQQIHGYRAALDERGLSTASVKGLIRPVRIVYNWGERNELLGRNRWHLFVHKVAKEKRTKPRAEYRADEFLRIWAALDPELAGQWRAWCLVGLLGIYGNRQHELLNLQLDWIDDARITIDPAFVKTGEERSLPLFAQTRRILDVAAGWRAREGYAGPYVFFPGQVEGRAHPSKEPHYTIQSLTDAIHRAERRAGLEPIRNRAGHGFRRGLLGDLADETGDITLALLAIGDRDLRQAQSYRVRRNDRVDAALLRRVQRLLGESAEGESATKVQPPAENDEAAPVGDSSKSFSD